MSYFLVKLLPRTLEKIHSTKMSSLEFAETGSCKFFNNKLRQRCFLGKFPGMKVAVCSNGNDYRDFDGIFLEMKVAT